ncbi:DUF6417 family protein [Streptomyces sp. NPDC001093]|uniref:DUF6417 family protein n=1 Tax=Streptomyces sp. NPDC001093 TaxID=3154376 RepID=UPI0033230C9D
MRSARQIGNCWSLYLTSEQIESVAYAFYLRFMGGSAAEANRFAREYGVVFHSRPVGSWPAAGPTAGPGCRSVLPEQFPHDVVPVQVILLRAGGYD